MQRATRGRTFSQAPGHAVSGVQVEVTGDRKDGVVTVLLRQLAEVGGVDLMGYLSTIEPFSLFALDRGLIRIAFSRVSACLEK